VLDLDQANAEAPRRISASPAGQPVATFSKFPVDFQCPRCNRNGHAEAKRFERDGQPVELSLQDITAGFHVANGEARPDDVRLVCGCGNQFWVLAQIAR
jgi:hypothetical protein